MTFPDLENWNATKTVLHEMSQVISGVNRKFLSPHEHWWHISLKVTPEGLTLDPIPCNQGHVRLGFDFHDHEVRISIADQVQWRWALTTEGTAHDLSVWLFPILSELGLQGLDPEKFAQLTSRGYEPAQAERFHKLMITIDRLFNQHRLMGEGDFGQVQLWPHGFDITIEWYGPRSVSPDESDSTKSFPTQLNLGWSPGEESFPEPYFFSNPWPFEEDFLELPLPEGAQWFTKGWKGTLLPYRLLVDDPEGEQKLLHYARGVFEMMRPLLS